MSWNQLVIAALALASTSCAQPSPAGQAAQTRQTIEAVFEAFNRHDAAAMVAFYAPDAVLTTSERCGPLQGRAAIEQHHVDLFAAIPDLQDEVTDYFVDGDRIAVRFVARSRLPSREFEMVIADFFVVRDGLVVADDTIFNAERPCQPDAAPSPD